MRRLLETYTRLSSVDTFANCRLWVSVDCLGALRKTKDKPETTWP